MNKENINLLIKKIQENNCKESQEILFKKYFFLACKWARKYIKKNVYTNLISYEKSEINSYVFLSFWRALKTYKFDDVNSLSFKNYFFQMIKYQTSFEIKKTFNWQYISNYHKKCKEYHKEIKNNLDSPKTYCEKLDIDLKCETIINFLLTKNEIYATIFKLKSIGYKNKEICERLGITDMEMKSKYQYIKKLIRNEFQNIDNIS